MLTNLPEEILGNIFNYTDGNLYNLSLVSSQLNQNVNGYLIDQLRSYLLCLSKGGDLNSKERNLLHLYRENRYYDELVFDVFEDSFFSFPIEFRLKNRSPETLDLLGKNDLEKGLFNTVSGIGSFTMFLI